MKTRVLISLALALGMAWSLTGQEPEAAPAAKGKAKGKAAQAEAPPAPPPIPQVLRLVRPGMYLITGRGANSVARVTPQGVVLVDSKLGNPGEYERLVELIRGVTAQPVKFVFNTSGAPESTGNNARFQAAGAEIATPDRTVTLGGVQVRGIRLGTRGAVYFPADKVLCVGDLPAGDPAWQAALSLDWTLAIPASGEPFYRSTLERRQK